ncbi:bifunctional salicylyl-CoA 5-hydroxylase/oxidoreductase [Hwanghaeella grinnelliae]|uniref:Bifunctional salicylyl-CoA 5-hydroxylase/oxidoreductase n=1 Tax=Hwanghaeella grinnelliae TaxID=2500179 RepID=A0A437QY37_9PROT|nr:bifunctional salicylyl-CoA 5-hydroxylase/oxidoreductase [Hwanghaeella grinnelliae]RVU39455.1 bifunctional salicylyl-CoA 5-hydroxylase/oxidoreductase [Hwanghaeella grinnelliae]
MKIACLGGGPAGLYFGISMKLRDPNHEIVVVERNRPYDTFGWGVVFSDQTMENLRLNDPKTADAILAEFAHWDDIDIHFKGECVTSTGHGFAGIGRKRMLNILQDRAQELGIELIFEQEVDGVDAYKDYDLIVASDGLNSKIRSANPEAFQPDIDTRPNKFIWLGTKKKYDAFTFIFEETEHGWIWVHAYKFDADTSTFIVECTEKTWRGLGLDKADTEQSIAICEEIFKDYLDCNALMSNARHLRGSAWLNFPRINCGTYHHDNVVLMGDAAHTAHFSIGSGTKLALEDAIVLADLLHSEDSMEAAFTQYQEARRLEVLKLQSAARNSMEWFEELERYTHFDPPQFAYSLLTRSQRVSHENLRLRDKEWLTSVERWFAGKSAAGVTANTAANDVPPPMFTPFRLRQMDVMNRIVVSPMATYSATDGIPNDFHLVHLGARAQGGAGLVFTEMTCVTPAGRITPGCPGLYSDEQEAAWKRIVDYTHQWSGAKIAMQLGHSGPKGSTKIGWEGMDQPLDEDGDEGNWELLAPSPVPWSPNNQTPREMTEADMDDVEAAFVQAVERADRCGFDMVEMHAAHGYLLSAFLTPLTNKRVDEYGGLLENRLRFPLRVFAAMRAAWPSDKPMSVRISANDWVGEEGITPDDAVEIARAFKQAGADIIDVSAGQTSIQAKPVYGRMFQTPFSDRIRNEAGIATMAVGNIFEVDHVNSILAAGRADLCCLARPHLADPYWTLHAAAEQGYQGAAWPNQYLPGRDQYERNLARAADMAIQV